MLPGLDLRTLYGSDEIAWVFRPDPEVETSHVERKSSFNPPEIAEAISAFANGQAPGGLIVGGVGPDGKLIGLSTARSQVEAGLNDLAGLVERASWEYRFVPHQGVPDQVLFVLVAFSPQRVICQANGSAYRRSGKSSRKLRSNEIQELRFQRGEVPFEDQPVAPFTEGLLDPDLSLSFLEGIRRRNGLTLPIKLDGALRDKYFLVRQGDGESLTVAGLLLLGRDPARHLGGARLRFLRFDGREELLGTQRNVIKDRWFDGPVPRVVAQFREFMLTQVREFDYLGAGGNFVTEPEYPEFTWEEAVVNALAHRSYSLGASVFVRMFDDRVEIESPGGFPGTVRPDHLFTLPRNPHLAAGLQYLDIVRLAHEGTRRMRREMSDTGLPEPLFEETDTGWVKVTLWNDVDRRRTRLGSGEADRLWSEVEQRLHDELAIVRREGLEAWRRLHQRGASPPSAILEKAVSLVRDPSLPVDEAHALLDLLRDTRGKALSEAASPLFAEVTSGRFKNDTQAMATLAYIWNGQTPWLNVAGAVPAPAAIRP